jgi:alpha-methylacyl-CoA racemase
MLAGLKVLEFSAIGPVPWATALLADLGAEVLRIDRPGAAPASTAGASEVLDLKQPSGRERALELVARSDVLVEGMRPGVMERLSLGPEVCLRLKPNLVYARMTGWGQDGPLAQSAGHDINYIALTGALHAIGQAGGPPVPPLNLLGDFGGGGTFLIIGILAALHAAGRHGHGRIVDVAMIDGVARLMAPLHARLARGEWRDMRGVNMLDGGAPWYGVYRTADDLYMAVGAIEPAFYDAFVRGLGLDPAILPDRTRREHWRDLRARFEAAFAARTREQWCEIFDNIDACVSPVLSLLEAPRHPHIQARATFVQRPGGYYAAAAAPRFSSDR